MSINDVENWITIDMVDTKAKRLVHGVRSFVPFLCPGTCKLSGLCGCLISAAISRCLHYGFCDFHTKQQFEKNVSCFDWKWKKTPNTQRARGEKKPTTLHGWIIFSCTEWISFGWATNATKMEIERNGQRDGIQRTNVWNKAAIGVLWLKTDDLIDSPQSRW